jgi:hypothetical protein
MAGSFLVCSVVRNPSPAFLRVSNINEKELNQTKQSQIWDGWCQSRRPPSASINDTNNQFVAVGYDKKA